jgi:hypothetical protein
VLFYGEPKPCMEDRPVSGPGEPKRPIGEAR